jgi:hypothetical protein
MLDIESVPAAAEDVSLADSPSAVVAPLSLVPPPQAVKTAAERNVKVMEREREEY